MPRSWCRQWFRIVFGSCCHADIFFFRPHQPQDTLYDLVIAESATKLKVYSIQARSQAFPWDLLETPRREHQMPQKPPNDFWTQNQCTDWTRTVSQFVWVSLCLSLLLVRHLGLVSLVATTQWLQYTVLTRRPVPKHETLPAQAVFKTQFTWLCSSSTVPPT